MTEQSAVDGRQSAAWDALSTEFFREDPARMEVLTHPVRLKIIRLAAFREISAKDASAELGEPIGKVSYHVRVLADAGFLEVVRQTPRRGAIETHYRTRVLLDCDDETWDGLSADTRRRLMVANVQEWSADLVSATQAGGFEIEQSFLGSTHFEADDEGLDELRDALAAYYERLLEIEAAIAERRREDPGLRVTEVNVGLAFYGATRTPCSNGPFYIRYKGHSYPLIPEDPAGDED